MKFLFLSTFLLTFLFFDNSIGYYTGCAMQNHLYYNFQHVGAIHLLLNSYAFYNLFKLIQKYLNKYFLSIAIVSIASACSFGTFYHTPTVGASGMIYTMVGMLIALLLQKIVRMQPKFLFIFVIGLVASMSVSYFKSNTNFILHNYTMVSGFIFMIIRNLLIKKAEVHTSA